MRRFAFALLVLLTGCGSSEPQPPAASSTPARAQAEQTATPNAVQTPSPKLRDPAPCTDVPDATCYRLEVPLDRSDPDSRSVNLRVADGREVHFTPVQQCAAAVWIDQPGEHLDDGAFACAVVPAQTMDFAR